MLFRVCFANNDKLLWRQYRTCRKSYLLPSLKAFNNMKIIRVNVAEQIIHVKPLNLRDSTTALDGYYIVCANKINCDRSCDLCTLGVLFSPWFL